MSPIDRDELIELAQLEVLGVLDESDLARLDRLKRQAPPALHAELVGLQASLSSDVSLLPTAEPDLALKYRVLARVADAVEARDSTLVPIASIGRNHEAATNDRSMKANRAAMVREENAEVVRALASAARDSGTDALVIRWRRSAFLWRAATIAIAGGLLATLVANHSLSQRAATISELALSNSVHEKLSALVGPSFDEYVQGDGSVRSMVGVGTNSNSAAFFVKSALAQRAVLVAVNLTPKTTYEVIVKTGSDSWTVHTFTASASIMGVQVDLADALLGAGSLVQVVEQDSQQVVLSATI
ncbi:MAG: hypothetical protein O2800_04870 [Planctomycetota bacterium]|nr:hypothetical protein [Planctomycetota bacterium]